MASTSASSVQKSFKYDVFLSFRGEDTRKTFIDHLYHALDDKGIITYKDDERIEKGDRIDEQLIRSIEESRFHIIVFSKNYASSSWCLDELVKIMECQKMPEHTAYPIFYDVEPTEVRNQSMSAGEAFAKHAKEESTRKRTLEDADLENEDDVGRWRNALKEVAALAGMDLKNTFNGHEAKFIQKIVVDISLKLSFINWRIDEDLVGMETRVRNVVSSLEIGSEDVRMIGIWGMGGGGKTTLATAVFEHISSWFEGSSFVENVREVSKSSLFGLKELRKQVLSDVLNDQRTVVRSVSDGKNKMIKMMGSRKVLIVLDDVDYIGQLEALAGKTNWFKPGSRIIITTRDEQVLIAHGVRSDDIHDACLLSNEEAMCLFSRYAFKRETPNQGYQQLSRKVVHYAVGLPLTVKVLGSHLCGRSELEWVDAIERLKTIPLKETLKRLEISYDGLEDDHKEIFLDVVCILKGETIDRAIRVLESCGFKARIGLRVLEQRSLITTFHKYLGMHDHIEEMGRNVVRRLHPHEPSRHSRLWIKDEIEDILVNELVTDTRSIKLQDTDLHPTIIMKGLRNMRELRCLYVENRHREWKFDEDTEYLPDALQSLYWHDYCLCFQANELVNLEMNHSNISELWEGVERKVFKKLRFLNLTYSNLRTFDTRLTPCLEELYIIGSHNFVELHLPFICSNQKSINLSDTNVSYLGVTPHLEVLNLARCNNFVELQFPSECSNLKSIDLSWTKVSYLNTRLTPHLEELNLESCIDFVELPLPSECSNLKSINLSYTKVSYLDLGMTPHLERLNLLHCFNLQEIHAPVGCLRNLYFLDLIGCLRFQCFLVDKECKSRASLDLTGKAVDKCPLHPNSTFPKFQFECFYHERLPSLSGNIEKLISFGLCTCTNFESFSASISGLHHLERLSLEGNIPEALFNYMYRLDTLESLVLWMEDIKHIPDGIYMMKHLKSLELRSCKRIEHIPENICRFECLKSLTLLECILVERLPEELGRLKYLEELSLTRCKSLRDIPNSIGKMKCLEILNLSDCILVEQLPEELGRLKCLKKLNLIGCVSLREIPNSICNMKCLKSLILQECILVEKLPEELGCLECLEELNLAGCRSLREIPKTIYNMKCLKSLDLCDCILDDKLPKELGRLECLKWVWA